MNRTVVLAAHGSRAPRAGATVRALARAVADASPGWDVRAAFLELTGPHLADVLAALDGRPAVLVPLLLTPAYHARTDLPGIVASARRDGARVDVAPILGPDPGVPFPPVGPGATRGAVPLELVTALLHRLGGARRGMPAQTGRRPTGRPMTERSSQVGADALVLAAAGSRDPAALASVEAVAAALGAATGLPCRAGYASGLGERVADAVAGARAEGARTVAVASYFLAPGLLYDRAAAAAVESAVDAVAPPLGPDPALVTLVRRRVHEASGLSIPLADLVAVA